jgi:midasin
MDLDGAFHDPLKLNLNRQTRIVISKLPPTSPYVKKLHHDLASSQRDLLATLSSLLAVPSLTLTVANLFRPVLIPLCAQWLADPEQIEEKLIALCLLVQPHEELFP